jgi:hypothetical protein
MQAFIVRPFGLKEGIDFEKVEEDLIQEAFTQAGIVGRSTKVINAAGNIRDDMFQMILAADLVVADITLHNANVFYELGIRHSLRSRQTFLIRGKTNRPSELDAAPNEVPFDLKTDRYLAYDPDDLKASVADLVKGLKETIATRRLDSPVFRSLPKLKEPEPSVLSPVPLTFVDEVDLAARKGQGGKLGLFGEEARYLQWESGGRRVVGRRQFAGKFLVAARKTWEAILTGDEMDLEANLALGTIYQKLGEPVLSDQSLDRVLSNPQASVNERTEAFSLRARNAKVEGRELLVGMDLEGRIAAALRVGMFRKARDLYAAAFSENLNHFYSGLNALSLTMLLLDLIERQRDTWSDMFDTPEAAAHEENFLKVELLRLVPTAGISVDAAKLRDETKNDVWVDVSRADYLFLTASRDSVAATAYEQVLPRISKFQFHIGSVRDQLELFALLDFRSQRVASCLKSFPLIVPEQTLRQAMVFTGHMIDSPGREKPRFPQTAEATARAMIHAQVSELLRTYPGPALGIAGAASGGDILFHEVCRELGIPTRILLTLPENLFIERSVEPAGPTWTARFRKLMENHPAPNEVQVLASTPVLPDWMRDRPAYDAWQRTNLWLLEDATAAGATNVTLIALWDGEPGEAGGTQTFINMAREHGMAARVLDAKDLLA